MTATITTPLGTLTRSGQWWVGRVELGKGLSIYLCPAGEAGPQEQISLVQAALERLPEMTKAALVFAGNAAEWVRSSDLTLDALSAFVPAAEWPGAKGLSPGSKVALVFAIAGDRNVLDVVFDHDRAA